MDRVYTAQGKQKIAKRNSSQGKHREFGKFAKICMPELLIPLL